MRKTLAVATVLASAVFAQAAFASEGPLCQPSPLTQSHPASVQVPNTAVDLGGAAPATATNPLMQGFMEIRPSAVSRPDRVIVPINPLTHRP